jgi:hypothetical protein
MAKEIFRNRARSARNAAREVGRQAQQAKERTQRVYRRLLHITHASVKHARDVSAVLREVATKQTTQIPHRIVRFAPLAQ